MQSPEEADINVDEHAGGNLWAPKVHDCQSCEDAADYHAEAYGGLVETRNDETLRAKATLVACKYHGNRSRKILSAMRFTGFEQYFVTLANGESYLSDSPTGLVNAKPYKP